MEMEIEKRSLFQCTPLKKYSKTPFIRHKYILHFRHVSPPGIYKRDITTIWIFGKGDKIYVSCTSGKTKQDGSLFDLVAQENNINFHNWEHWGDNKHSDYLIPKRKVSKRI